VQSDIDRLSIPQEQIPRRVAELAAMITADHSPPALAGTAEVTIVPVLTGAMILGADLIRHIPLAMQIGLMTVSSYPGRSVSTQGAQVVGQQLGQVEGRHVVLVDDVLDSGQTVRMVQAVLREREVASLRTCVLLRKDRPETRDIPVDYVGFDIPDVFVVGYGLDFNNYYRNLPDIVTLRAAVTGASA